ncbi:MAG: hypothetical protein GY780_13160 [bacterium]|nr:hypothetical protein [bacterium]
MRNHSTATMMALFGAIGLVLVPSMVLAQPDIQNVEGVIENGAVISISGNSFGQAGELISWDDFETGSDEQGLGSPIVGPDWTLLHPSSNTPPAAYSEIRAFSGDVSAKVAWKEPGYSGYSINAFGWAGKGPYNSVYLSYWRYHDPSNLSFENVNHKQVYMYGNANSNGYSELQQWLSFMIPAGTTSWHSQLQNQPTKIHYWSGGPHYDDSTYIWGRWETWVDYEDEPELNDGHVMAWYNGQEVLNNSGENLCNPDGGNYVHDIRIGHMFSANFSQYDHVRSFFDDVYISTSRARIELGNNPVFEDCTLREIQVPGEWTGSNIDAVLHFSLFHSGEPVYLFIVDENNVASDGYALQVGEGESPDGPGIPGQPVRQ